jgi:hypothetical protein
MNGRSRGWESVVPRIHVGSITGQPTRRCGAAVGRQANAEATARSRSVGRKHASALAGSRASALVEGLCASARARESEGLRMLPGATSPGCPPGVLGSGDFVGGGRGARRWSSCKVASYPPPGSLPGRRWDRRGRQRTPFTAHMVKAGVGIGCISTTAYASGARRAATRGIAGWRREGRGSVGALLAALA